MQGDLKLGLETAVRELTSEELEAQSAFFALAEKFYVYVDHKLNGRPGLPFPAVSAETNYRIEAMRSHAYTPSDDLPVKLPPKLQLSQDVFLLTSVFTADMFKLAVEKLSTRRSEVLAKVRILSEVALDRDEHGKLQTLEWQIEKLEDKLNAIQQLVAGANTDFYVNEVLERAEHIRERSNRFEDTYEDAIDHFTEALTVS